MKLCSKYLIDKGDLMLLDPYRIVESDIETYSKIMDFPIIPVSMWISDQFKQNKTVN